MAAREKSKPRDRRGTLAGDPYVLEWSTFGARGTRSYVASEDIRSRGGICSERPRKVNAGRRGVVGSSSEVSSFDLFSGSRNFGDGDKTGSLPSDSDLPLDGDRDRCRDSVFPSLGFLSSDTAP